VVVAGGFLLKSTPPIKDAVYNGELGGLKKFELVKRGELEFSLKALSAHEFYPQLNSFMTTTLVTYYELQQVEFNCELEGFGHVRLKSHTGQLDIQMKHLRLTNLVIIDFDSGYSAKAKKVDINLLTGHVKPVELSLSINGHDMKAGSRSWQMQ
jgi:hypothetical protein